MFFWKQSICWEQSVSWKHIVSGSGGSVGSKVSERKGSPVKGMSYLAKLGKGHTHCHTGPMGRDKSFRIWENLKEAGKEVRTSRQRAVL